MVKYTTVSYWCSFSDHVGLGTVIPLYSSWMASRGIGFEWVGYLLAVQNLFQFFGAIVLGKLTDRYSVKSILFVTLSIEVLAFLATALSPNIIFLVSSRALAGISSPFTPSTVILSRYSENKTREMGVHVSCSLIGILFGTVITTVTSASVSGIRFGAYDYDLDFFISQVVASATSTIPLILLTRYTEETYVGDQVLPQPDKNTNRVWSNHTILRCALYDFTAGIVLTSASAIGPVIFATTYLFASYEWPMTLCVSLLLNAIFVLKLMGYCFETYGGVAVTRVAHILLLVSCGLMIIGDRVHFAFVGVSVLLITVSSTILMTQSKVKVSEEIARVDPGSLGFALGITRAMFVVGALIAGTTSFMLYDYKYYLPGIAISVVVVLSFVANLTNTK